MNAELQTLSTISPQILESLVCNGDCKVLNQSQRVEYYRYRCNALGLDPATQPFAYIQLNGKLVLYALAATTQQLTKSRNLSVEIVSKDKVDDSFIVQARVKGADGRSSDNIGAVSVAGLKGESLSNAMMKAVTKAIRRAVLAHEGLGMLDETEAETIPGAKTMAVEEVAAIVDDPETFEWTEEDRQNFYTFCDVMTDLADKAAVSEKDLEKRLKLYKDQLAAQEDPQKVLARMTASIEKLDQLAKKAKGAE